MTSAIIQLLVLAGIAVFLAVRLRNVLGSREGFEKPPHPPARPAGERDLRVIDGGADESVTDFVPEGTPAAQALHQMKAVEPGFSVRDFLEGARHAYEMIVDAFERGDLSEVEGLLGPEVREAMEQVIREREQAGLSVEGEFVGVRELRIRDAHFDPATRQGEITVEQVGELSYVVRDAEGNLVEGAPGKIRRQRDVWTWAREMGADDPNWKLVATGE